MHANKQASKQAEMECCGMGKIRLARDDGTDGAVWLGRWLAGWMAGWMD